MSKSGCVGGQKGEKEQGVGESQGRDGGGRRPLEMWSVSAITLVNDCAAQGGR